MARVNDRLAVYVRARTVHLERFAELGADFIFYRRNYDFDENLARRVPHRHLGRRKTFLYLLRTPYRAVELNEPFQLNAWPGLILSLTAVRLSDVIRRRHTIISAYAIGNDDLAANFAAYTQVPVPVARWIVRRMMRYFVARYDRIAFGLPITEEIYRDLSDRSLARISTKRFGALAPACSSHDLPRERARRVVFLGALEARKGFERLLEAWALVPVGKIELVVLGKGELVGKAAALASSRPDVEFIEAPPPERIHEELARGSVLVLFSQRTDRWREQIGLPILEGLSHGCTVVASTETGVAQWLIDHGHRVLEADADAARLAAVIQDAVEHPLPVEEVLRSLPERDTRLAAAEWMLGSTHPSNGN
ncbi:glycosyltransferase involved in cell wall biosynthesis [Rathayibacter agropyri]